MIHQQRHVLALVPEASKLIGEALDRHVGDRQQMVELEAESVAQFLMIARLQFGLRGRQKSADRVVHEVERESAVRHSVAEVI